MKNKKTLKIVLIIVIIIILGWLGYVGYKRYCCVNIFFFCGNYEAGLMADCVKEHCSIKCLFNKEECLQDGYDAL